MRRDGVRIRPSIFLKKKRKMNLGPTLNSNTNIALKKKKKLFRFSSWAVYTFSYLWAQSRLGVLSTSKTEKSNQK